MFYALIAKSGLYGKLRKCIKKLISTKFAMSLSSAKRASMISEQHHWTCVDLSLSDFHVANAQVVA